MDRNTIRLNEKQSLVEDCDPNASFVTVEPASMSRRHGSPRVGLSLATAAELHGAPIRDAVRILTNGFREDRLIQMFNETFLKSFPSTLPSLSQCSLTARVAWNLVAIWLTANIYNEELPIYGIQDAEVWFMGDDVTPKRLFSTVLTEACLREAEQILSTINLNAKFEDLLPYIFEEHGPGSRASVMKDPTTAAARVAKREVGVFYTPSDVAEYMVEHTRNIYGGDFLNAKALDPACGTGVFLIALLRNAARHGGSGFSKFDFITSCLHGFDISFQALDIAALLLLKECLTEVQARNISPYTAWHAIRQNLVEMDALTVDAIHNDGAHCSPNLFANLLPALSDLFPKVQDGFDILVGNPPYAALSKRTEYDLLETRFASLKGIKANSAINLFPLFIEMMWRFTKHGCNASALVTPLSIAYHSRTQYENCRNAMSCSGGQWQFAFFDREPHALFGEEVKTRNAILFRSESTGHPKRGHTANIATGPLRKWTSRTRANLFQRIDYTQLDSLDISAGIPRLNGDMQAEAYMSIKHKHGKFTAFAEHIGKCTPTEALICDDTLKIFVGGTAYNFLNVYRATELKTTKKDYPLSESLLHCLKFKTKDDANVAFSILSSRLVFWLWHVLGDGFHVSKSLFNVIPYDSNSFSKSEFNSLAAFGNDLWSNNQQHRFVSLNRGKQTVGFRPNGCHEELNSIDEILIKSVSLDNRFSVELQRFVKENTLVDPMDEKRKYKLQHFTERINL